MGVGTIGKVDTVGIGDQLLRQLVPDQLGKLTANLIGEGELAVRECARTRKSRGDIAFGAVHACLGHALRTASVLHGLTLFDEADAGLRLM